MYLAILLLSGLSTPCQAPPEGMSCIPGGAFLRGTDRGDPPAQPQSSVEVGTFYMDINEVSNADYRVCVKAKRCKKAGPKYSDFSRPQQPINGLSWFDALNYCEAMGKHLPTEAEWEKAARGVDGRRFPWGDEPATCKRAVIKDKRGRSCGVKKASGIKPETGRVWLVAQKPAAIHGLRDMAGNSYEWVYDWYSESWAECGAACQGPNPKGPCEGKAPCKGHRERVVRGGSWYWPGFHATTYHRRAHLPSNRPFHHFGFRCAASLEEAKELRRAPASNP